MLLADFLKFYRSSIMGEDYIEHEFRLESGKHIQKRDNSSKVYIVEGVLSRYMDNARWRTKDQKIRLEIVYDEKAEYIVHILSIKMDTTMKRILSSERDEYIFQISSSAGYVGHVDYHSHNISIYVKSLRRHYVEYEGIESQLVSETEVPFKCEVEGGKTTSNSTTVFVQIPENKTSKDRQIELCLTQEGSGKSICKYIRQDKLPWGRRSVRFTLTNYDEWFELRGHYCPGKMVGLTFMNSYEDSRLAVGFSLYICPELFSLKYEFDDSHRNTMKDKDYTACGYQIHRKGYSPGDDDYSDMRDYNGVSREVNMMNAFAGDIGVYLNNTFRLDLALGGACMHPVTIYDKAYYFDVYDYVPEKSDDPEFKTVHRYGYVNNYCQYEKARFGLFIRPALNIGLKLSSSCRLTLNGGYVFTPFISGGCRPDVSVGLQFY